MVLPLPHWPKMYKAQVQQPSFPKRDLFRKEKDFFYILTFCGPRRFGRLPLFSKEGALQKRVDFALCYWNFHSSFWQVAKIYYCKLSIAVSLQQVDKQLSKKIRARTSAIFFCSALKYGNIWQVANIEIALTFNFVVEEPVEESCPV